MSRNKNETGQTETEQTEPKVDQTAEKTELTSREIMQKLLADKQTSALKAVEAANKQAEEAQKLANIDIDADVESVVDEIKAIDADVVKVKAAMTAEIEPLNKQILEIKAKPEYKTEDQNDARKVNYDVLVEKVGETAAKLLCGVAKSTGTGIGTGRGRGSGTRDQVIAAICDDGLTFAEAAEKYDHMGNGERDGSQKVGNLVKRHIDLAVKDGSVSKNDDGTYSRA